MYSLAGTLILGHSEICVMFLSSVPTCLPKHKYWFNISLHCLVPYKLPVF